jgi:uncharacterized protein (DUF58 family)
MRRAPSVRLTSYVAVAAAASLAGLALGRPELVAVAAPFAAFVALGILRTHAPELTVTRTEFDERALEGEELRVTVELTATADIERLQARLQLSRGQLALRTAALETRRLRAGEPSRLNWSVRLDRWGSRRLELAEIRCSDRFGLFSYALSELPVGVIRVFPTVETLRTLIAPLELQATSGSRVSRERGEGIEFAEVRPYVPGDRVRRINWRVTARRGAPHVSERHPERNADVILFLDTFVDVADEQGSTLGLAVRAAASLAAGYLARKDRVGLVSFGGALSGLGPRLGEIQLYRIIDALLGSEVLFSYAEKEVSFVPRHLLPAKALVIVISPLIDQRALGAMFDLRARGFDLAVLDVSPVQFAPPGPSPGDALAHRLWLLRREAIRNRIQELGVPVTEWRGEEPLQAPIAHAAEFRRRVRLPARA